MAGGGRRRGGGKRSTGATRRPAVRVRTAKGRRLSSTRWLERQLNDPYVAEARRLGYRSRAAFKLIEIDDKARLLRPGLRVVDLGAAPGGWTQIAAERVRAGQAGGGHVVALDILPMDGLAGVDVLELDFLDNSAPARLRAALGGPADVVLSDMAAPTTGHPATDHLRIMALVEAAFVFACEVLAPGGAFVAKVFQGGTEHALLAEMKRHFARVRHIKPPSSRPESAETYVVATGFRSD